MEDTKYYAGVVQALDEFLQNIKHCAGVDFQNLNDICIESANRKKRADRVQAMIDEALTRSKKIKRPEPAENG